MSVTLQGGCCVSGMREGDSIVAGTLRIWNRIGRATGAQAISLRAMEFAPGMSPTIRNDECDEILYVLERGPDSERGHPARMNEGQTATILLDDHRYDIAPDT